MMPPIRPRPGPSVFDAIRTHAERDGDRTVYAFHDADGQTRASFSYANFVERTADIALHLVRERVCAPGDRVILLYPPGIEVLCAFFACVRLGAIPVPACPPASHGFAASLHRLNFIADDCDAVAVLTDRACYWSMKLRRVRSRITSLRRARDPAFRMPWIITDDAPPGADRAVPERRSPVLFLQYTSGSTGDPRGVMVSHENVLANGAAIFPEAPIGVSWLPQYHDMGLIGACLHVALAGGTTHLLSPLDFLRRPASWLQAMHHFRATASAAPNFAYALCLRRDKLPDEELDGLDLSSLRLLMNGAEPVRADVFRRFRERFEPHGLRAEAFCAAYGLAESTLAVSNRGTRVHAFDAERLALGDVVPAHETAGGRATSTLVSCGRPVAGTDIRIVDVSGVPAEVPRGRIGEIWVDGPACCLGYWGRRELTRRTFGARLERSPEPERSWLRTGDLGFLHDGELFVCGRLKDLIIIRGVNYYPQDIETIIGRHPAIRTGCVAAFAMERNGAEEVAVVAEVRDGKPPPEVATELNAALRRDLGIVASSFTYVAKRTIPKTSSGKIMRRETRTLMRESGLDVVARVECGPPMPTLDPAGAAHDDEENPGSPEHGAPGWGTPAALDRTFARRGLSGREDGTLADHGLDSLALAEFGLEVEKHLRASTARDLAEAVDLRWLQRIAVSELRDLLGQLLESAPLARLRFRKHLDALRSEFRQLEHDMMRRDAKLEVTASSTPGNDRSLRLFARERRARGVLLTGGTGFFGPFLLRSLLEQTDGPVHVLVRARNRAHAEARLEEALDSLGPRLRTTAVDGWRRRVVPVCGDLGRAHLGLDRGDWHRLAEEVDAVFHNGAWVNYLLDYATLRPVNVVGTLELLRLAVEGRPKVVNHVSTTFVFGWSTTETLLESDTNRDLAQLDFGYSQSKWVSEQIVRKAMERGMPGRIFRPALIAPSVCGGGENFDIAMRLLTFMLEHGISTTAQNQVSLSPADLVADNIVAISTNEATVGRTFHVTRDRRSTMRDVTDLLARYTRREFQHHPLDEFVPEIVQRCGPDDLLFPLLNFLVRSVDNIAAMEFKEYDNRNYRDARAASGGRGDPPLDEVVGGIARFMRRHGLVPGRGRRVPHPPTTG